MSHFIKEKKAVTRNFTTKNNHPLTQAVFAIIGIVLGRTWFVLWFTCVGGARAMTRGCVR